MALSLKELITPITKDQAMANALATLANLGFPTTNWADDSVPMVTLHAVTDLYADLRTAVYNIATGGYLDLATGPWLTLLAASQYQRDRLGAVFAEGLATLTAAAASGPHTIVVGQLVISNASGKRFVNTTGGVLPLGGTLQLSWKAETPGADWNVGVNTVNLIVAGAIAGVSVNNPSIGGSTWLTISGADEETDAQLRVRCKTRWAELAAVTGPPDLYKSLALNTPNTGVRRAYVNDSNPRGPGTVDVYVAGETGPSPPAEVTAVDAYIQPRRAISSDILILPAVGVTISVVGTVYAKATLGITAADCQAAVEAYFKTLDIGGDRIAALAPARLFRDQIEKPILNLGATAVDLTSPATDPNLADYQVAVPDIALTVVGI